MGKDREPFWGGRRGPPWLEATLRGAVSSGLFLPLSLLDSTGRLDPQSTHFHSWHRVISTGALAALLLAVDAKCRGVSCSRWFGAGRQAAWAGRRWGEILQELLPANVSAAQSYTGLSSKAPALSGNRLVRINLRNLRSVDHLRVRSRAHARPWSAGIRTGAFD